MLLSELAHDDLTFTMRVALNEALYLRREAPPRVPPQKRVVLIDCGLRMWGLPRVFATAAAMALAVSRDARSETTVYRARGLHLDIVNLTTREGLVSHLAALEPEAHPGESLNVFRRLIVDDEEVNEAVLITCHEVLADKAFQRQLNEFGLPALYIVAVSRNGNLRLSRRSPHGTKVLRELKCPLEEILAPRPGVTPLRDDKYDPALPAILRMQPFPLRLSHAIDPQRLWGDAESGCLYVTTDRRLMYWDKRGQGARQISDTIPAGKLLWHDSGPIAQTMSTAVVGRLQQGDLHVLHIDRESGVCMAHSIALCQPRQGIPKGIAAHAGALFVVFAAHVEVYSLGDGGWIDTRALPRNMWWLRDRFFYSPEGWYALAFNGTTAQFELVCDKRLGDERLLISLFDAVGVDGPVAVTAKGEIGCLELQGPSRNQKGPHLGLRILNAACLPPGGPFRVAAIAADGQRVVLSPMLDSSGGPAQSLPNRPRKQEPSSWLSLSSRANSHSSMIDLRLLVAAPVAGDPAAALATKLLGTISNRTLRHKFVTIFADGGVLVLEASRGRHLCRFEWDSFNRRIQLKLTPPTSAGGKRVPFELSTLAPAGSGYRLSVAKWDDGSRAYLDSRGLLHLKSSDPSIPDLTLVLCDGTTAGWCANGKLFGSSYFTGSETYADPTVVFNDVLNRFVMVLRCNLAL